MPMPKRIKIYGERNSNTNYLGKLLELNLKAQQLRGTAPRSVNRLQKVLPGKELITDLYFFLTFHSNLGWKHARVKPIEQLLKVSSQMGDLNFITITKNPYSWLLSLHRNSYHQYYSEKPSFEQFLQMPWETIFRDNISGPLKNPIELWNIKNNSYLQLKSFIALNLTAESILEDPKKVIDTISRTFSREKLSDELVMYEQSTKAENKDSNYYQDYYLNERWRDKISNEAVSVINETVDKTLMSYFGYHVLPD